MELDQKSVATTAKRSAAAFRKTEVVTLPSGLEVEARKPDVLRLIVETPDENVPTYLIEKFSAGQTAGVEEADTMPPVMNKDELRKMSLFMDIVVKAAIVWPVIVDHPQAEDEIAISDLDMADRQHVFMWAMPTVKAE
jgi:hypothetical protein